MDNRPVGIFDSGSGGLPAAGALRASLPNENIIYLGDLKLFPYGGRSKDELAAAALRNIGFLKTFNVKAILVACGTISANIPQIFSEDSATPVFGVMLPAVKAALSATRTGRIGIAATKRAVASGAFKAALEAERSGLSIISVACPEFAPMTESGHISSDDPLVRKTVREYLEPVAEFGADTLILGCTHYSLLTGAIADLLGPGVRLADAGETAAAELSACLHEKDMLTEQKEPGSDTFYYSGGNPEQFAKFAGMIFKKDIGADMKFTDLTAAG